ncbi:hypothetical protein [Methanoregula sp.]|uniref:hypothetical protein n=1 Tax=Methanoregula sp. TaxID=2052170 RepID=UPI002372CFF3|nr:hypothetical protein [Methanoregula sp.]MDD1685614.1 hypothetical protein [Methanoregula sp.]
MRFRYVLPAACIIALIAVAGCTGTGIFSGLAPTPSATPTTVATTPSTTIPTPEPTTIPVPYPQARALGEKFPFGMGKVASNGTVYRYWINDTYHWHNDVDNRYYTETAAAGYKYLFVFVQMTNSGDTRVWYPPARTILVHYDGTTYTHDYTHYIPDKAEDDDAKPIEILEIQYFGKLSGDEYVEDFGYSHGTTADFLYPGTSNSLDGYIIYQVPGSLRPEKTYVEIGFNGQDTGIWKLA